GYRVLTVGRNDAEAYNYVSSVDDVPVVVAVAQRLRHHLVVNHRDGITRRDATGLADVFTLLRVRRHREPAGCHALEGAGAIRAAVIELRVQEHVTGVRARDDREGRVQ